MEEVLLTKNAGETQHLAESLARFHLGGKDRTFLLYGNLGAGKTTFVQGFAKGLGIVKRIISPTFTIVRSYEVLPFVIASQLRQTKQSQEIATSHTLRDDDRKQTFYHVDLYRLENEEQIKGIGLIELMQNPENIIVIEWPERLGKLIPTKATQIYFEVVGENERKIKVKQF